MIEFLSNGWIGNLIGLVGIVIGYLLFRKSQRIPEPRITIQADHALTWSDNLPLPPAFEIKFNGTSVPRVARSVVRLWNGGAGCLRKELIPSHDPLRLTLGGDGSFLVVNLINSSNPANHCNVAINPSNPSEALITFEFLDQNDGCSIGVLHTASKAAPVLKGSVMGYKFKVIEAAPRKASKGHARWFRPLATFWLPLIIGVFAIASGILSYEQLYSVKEMFGFTVETDYRPHSWISRVATIIVGISYLVISFLYYWQNRRLFPKNLRIVPKEIS